MKTFGKIWILLLGLVYSVVAQDKTSPTMPVDWADSTTAKSMSDVTHAMSPKYVNLRIKKVVDSLAAVQPKKGDTGATGPQGPAGPVGAAGQSIVGPQGAPGGNGSNGTNGTNGTNGITPTITIGTVTTLAYGATPTFTNIGTATNIIWNVAIPVGKDGTTGSTGASGVSGPQALTASSSQSVPLIAVGGTYSFTVACAGAVVGMPVAVSWPPGLLINLSAYSANVETNGVITTRLTALVLISAGTKTFYYRVLQ